MKKYLNTIEAAQYLGLSATTLNKRRCFNIENQPPWVSLGRSIRYSTLDLDYWLEKKKTYCDQSNDFLSELSICSSEKNLNLPSMQIAKHLKGAK